MLPYLVLCLFRGERDDVVTLTHVEPEWDPTSRSYVLDLGKRVTESSSKNFILQERNIFHGPTTALICGRSGTDTFVCDFGESLNALQAFAVALSSFEFKLCNAL